MRFLKINITAHVKLHKKCLNIYNKKENDNQMSRNRRRKRRQRRVASIVLIIVALILIAGVGAYMLVSKQNGKTENLFSTIENKSGNIISAASKNSGSTSVANDDNDLYSDFLSGNGILSFSYYFSDNSKAIHETSSDYELFSNLSKQEYSLPDLTKELNQIFTNPNGWYVGNEISKIEYSYLDCGNDGNKELAIRLECPVVEENSNLTMIIKNIDGKLQLIHSFDGWSRNDASINEFGYYTSGGSNGAACHVLEVGYIDATGNYHFGYSEEDYAEVESFGDSFDHTDFDTSTIEGQIEIFTLRTKPADMEDYLPQYYAYSIYDNGNDTDGLYTSGPYKDIMDSFTNINFMQYTEMMKIESDRNEEIGATENIINGNSLEFTEITL